jgi:hypothetical protein
VTWDDIMVSFIVVSLGVEYRGVLGEMFVRRGETCLKWPNPS